MRDVVLAIRGEDFTRGRVFDEPTVRTFRQSLISMAMPWVRLAQAGRARGYRFYTADQVGDAGLDPRQVLLISYDWPPDATDLLARGARPALLLTMEPPVIAWWLYANLGGVSARFPTTLVFPGGQDRVAPTSRFEPMRFPVEARRYDGPDTPWAERRHLVMVNSNKALVRSPRRAFDRPREFSVKREVTALLRYRPIDRDLYHQRMAFVRAFASDPSFDLYGEGWERRHPAISPRDYAAALRAYRGRANGKASLLNGYRFSVATENSVFPGYLSEKLFDCFLAGTVPVYLGAPDVERYVPKEAFVDLRQFRDYRELGRYLAGVSEAEWRAYRDAGEAFLASPAFAEYSLDRFAARVLDALDRVA